MADELHSGLLRGPGLRVLWVESTECCQEAALRHQAKPAAATLLAQGLTAALLLGALQKERARVNVQLECDGPLRGLFADADSEGNVRGYVKNPLVEFTGDDEAFRFRPVLGNQGFLSVLRDLGNGEHYRSSVELSAFDFSVDLERYFLSSDQVDSLVRLEVFPGKDTALGQVVGLLVQLMPDGDAAELERLRGVLGKKGALAEALQGEAGGARVLSRLFPDQQLEVMAKLPVQFKCRCSRQRVTNALLALGKEQLLDVLAKEGKASITCDFCITHYEIGPEEIRGLLEHAS